MTAYGHDDVMRAAAARERGEFRPGSKMTAGTRHRMCRVCLAGATPMTERLLETIVKIGTVTVATGPVVAAEAARPFEP